MKSILKIFLLFAVGLIISCKGTTESSDHAHAEGETYTCPMHPQIVQDKPGTCPICKMDLVLVKDDGGENELMLSDSQIQLANIHTVKVGEGSFNSSKILNGRVVSNPESSEIISSKYPGRIEKLFVKETGRPVSKGQPLFQIYSEALQTLQQDYLLQVKQSAAFPNEKIYQSLKEAAKNKLRLYGYSNAQIAELQRKDKVPPQITVFATASGIVNEINVSEGQYVAEGSPILRVENLSRLWLEADVYPSEMKDIAVGRNLKVEFPSLGEEQNVKVEFVGPQISASTQLLTIRASINNSGGKLQPGMQARVFLPVSNTSTKAIKLPLGAVVRDEKGAHVWVKTGSHTFAPVMVSTGAEDANEILITGGLKNGQEVVSSGAYLLYSEFVLKKGADPMAAHNH